MVTWYKTTTPYLRPLILEPDLHYPYTEPSLRSQRLPHLPARFWIHLEGALELPALTCGQYSPWTLWWLTRVAVVIIAIAIVT